MPSMPRRPPPLKAPDCHFRNEYVKTEKDMSLAKLRVSTRLYSSEVP